jgi:DNA-binding response OmpR family regulator
MTAGKTILIIDDDFDFHTLVGAVLRKSGYCVKSIFDGKIKEILGTLKGCDMVLLDVELPSMDGVEVGQKVREDPRGKTIPIIMITGHTDGEILFKASKANAFIQKPFTISGLMKKITEGFTQANA